MIETAPQFTFISPREHDCTVIAGKDPDGKIVTDVFLQLFPGANPGEDHSAAIREVLGEAAAATLRRVVTVRDSDDDIVLGPTGKVRKFLMRERHLSGAAIGS
jgi:hypothetical protein